MSICWLWCRFLHRQCGLMHIVWNCWRSFSRSSSRWFCRSFFLAWNSSISCSVMNASSAYVGIWPDGCWKTGSRLLQSLQYQCEQSIREIFAHDQWYKKISHNSYRFWLALKRILAIRNTFKRSWNELQRS